MSVEFIEIHPSINDCHTLYRYITDKISVFNIETIRYYTSVNDLSYTVDHVRPHWRIDRDPREPLTNYKVINDRAGYSKLVPLILATGVIVSVFSVLNVYDGFSKGNPLAFIDMITLGIWAFNFKYNIPVLIKMIRLYPIVQRYKGTKTSQVLNINNTIK